MNCDTASVFSGVKFHFDFCNTYYMIINVSCDTYFQSHEYSESVIVQMLVSQP